MPKKGNIFTIVGMFILLFFSTAILAYYPTPTLFSRIKVELKDVIIESNKNTEILSVTINQEDLKAECDAKVILSSSDMGNLATISQTEFTQSGDATIRVASPREFSEFNIQADLTVNDACGKGKIDYTKIASAKVTIKKQAPPASKNPSVSRNVAGKGDKVEINYNLSGYMKSCKSIHPAVRLEPPNSKAQYRIDSSINLITQSKVAVTVLKEDISTDTVIFLEAKGEQCDLAVNDITSFKILKAPLRVSLSTDTLFPNSVINVKYEIEGDTSSCDAIYPLITSETTADSSQYLVNTKLNILEQPNGNISVKTLKQNLDNQTKLVLGVKAVGCKLDSSNTVSILMQKKETHRSFLNASFHALKTKVKKDAGKIEVARIEFSLPAGQDVVDSGCYAKAEVNIIGGTAKSGVDFNFKPQQIDFKNGSSETKVGVELDILKGDIGNKTILLEAIFSSNDHCPINSNLQSRNYQYDKVEITIEGNISPVDKPASKNPTPSEKIVEYGDTVTITYNISGNTTSCDAIYPEVISGTTASEDQYRIDRKQNLIESPIISVKISNKPSSEDKKIFLAAKAEGCELAINDEILFLIRADSLGKLSKNDPEDLLEKICKDLTRKKEVLIDFNKKEASFFNAQCNGNARDFEPEEVAVQATSVRDAASQQLQNIRSRLNTLRATKGKRGIDVSGATLNIQGASVSAALLGGAAGDDENGLLENSRWGGFANGNYNFGAIDRGNINQNTKGKGDRNFDFNSKGLTVGADYRFSGEKKIAGVAIGYKDFRSDFTSQEGGSNLKGHNVSVYGTYLLSDEAYLDATIGYGKDKIDSRRPVNNDGSKGSQKTFAMGKPEAQELTFSAGGGYEFHEGEWSLTPYGRMDFIKGTIDAYKESVTNKSAESGQFNFKPQNMEGLTSTMGVKATRIISTSSGVFAPYASAEWKHEFKEQGIIKGSLVDPSITLDRDFEESHRSELNKDYYNLGIGVSAQFRKGKSAFVGVESRQGDSVTTDTAVRAGFRWEF